MGFAECRGSTCCAEFEHACTGNAAAHDVLAHLSAATVAVRPVCRSTWPRGCAGLRYLVSDDAAHLNGTILHVNGGVAHTGLT